MSLVYLEHLHVGAELLDERLDDGLGRGRGGDADALGRHLLPRVVLVLRLLREERFQWCDKITHRDTFTPVGELPYMASAKYSDF